MDGMLSVMKILFFRYSLLSRGGDKMIVSHANYLVSRGHDVTLQAHKIDTLHQLHPEVRTLSMRWSGKVGTLISAIQRLDDYDCIVADIIPVAVMLAICNRNIIFYYAQDYDESYYPLLPQKLFIRLLYYIGLSCLRIKTIAVSEHLSKLFWERYWHHASIVENGVDPAIFHRNPDPDLLKMKNSRKSILVLSRKDYRKGFDLALKVIERLSINTDIQFEVWSVGETVESFPSNVQLRELGYLSGESVARVLSSADMFLYPSRHEGFPLMVVEAFACGCPVVTTDAVCFARNGVNALVAPVEDVDTMAEACNLLLSNPDAGIDLVQTAAEFAMEHNIIETLKIFEHTVKSMLGMNCG